MNIEKGNAKHELSPYMVTVLQDPEALASVYLEVSNRLKLIVSVRIEENRELDSSFDLVIASKDTLVETAYRVYTNQLSRIVSEVATLGQYKKTRFNIRVNIIEAFGKTNMLCHISNALMLTLMLSRIEMRYFPISSTCFIDDSERLYTEDEAAVADVCLTQAFICKKLSNDDEIVSFSISGGHINDKHIDRILSYLCGAANIVGRKLLEFAHKLATN